MDARLQPVCGHGRVFDLRVAPVILLDEPLGEICDAPFLLSILFILISEQFGLFSLILMLARASQGRWDVSGRVFIPLDFVTDMPALEFETGAQRGIGNVTVTLRGNSISTSHSVSSPMAAD